MYRVLLTAELPFASGRQSLPTDEAGFRVAEPTFDEAHALFVIPGDRANIRWITTYTLSAKLNRETNTYKDAYFIGATKEHTPITLYLCSLLPCPWMCVGWSGVVWHGKVWHPPYIGTHTLLDE